MNELNYFRSYLYVPASKPEIVAKAFNSDADCVVIDLEDAVHVDSKTAAREFVAEFLKTKAPKPFLVRINDPNGAWGMLDLEAIAAENLFGVRIPKVTNIETIKVVAKVFDAAKSNAQIHLLIESALGVQRAFELATADPRVKAISLGEADLESDLRVTNDEALKYSRNAIVVAARAAALRQPSQSVFPNTKDIDGLTASTIAAKAVGFFGRSVIHPSQVAVVNEIFTPTAQEVEQALQLLSWYDQMQASGNSVMALPNGDLLDPANIHYARFQVSLNQQLSN